MSDEGKEELPRGETLSEKKTAVYRRCGGEEDTLPKSCM